VVNRLRAVEAEALRGKSERKAVLLDGKLPKKGEHLHRPASDAAVGGAVGGGAGAGRWPLLAAGPDGVCIWCTCALRMLLMLQPAPCCCPGAC
jgi:hypothetical protein